MKYICCCFFPESPPSGPTIEELNARLLATQGEVASLRQALSSSSYRNYGTLERREKSEELEEKSDRKDANALSVSPQSDVSAPRNIIVAKYFQQFIIQHGNNDEITREDFAKFGQEIAKGLEGFTRELRQELRHEVREEVAQKLAVIHRLNYEQRVAVFEVLFGYTLDTNLQQCHDFATLDSRIRHLGSPERERTNQELREKALKQASEKLDAAGPLLEFHDGEASGALLGGSELVGLLGNAGGVGRSDVSASGDL